MPEQEIFQYQNYSVDDERKTVLFNFRLTRLGQVHDLTESLIFPLPLPNSPAVARILKALHLALGISYYKIFLPPVIRHPYTINSSEAAFWNNVFTGGLGEFLYVNKLDESKIANFEEQNGFPSPEGSVLKLEQKCILGIGGGKDSIVAGELLKSAGIELSGFVMATGEQLGQSHAVADIMRIPLYAIQRRLDPKLLELQESEGAYRGHIPISLIFGLVGSVMALCQNAAYVVVANEASASIPGKIWNEREVNHQWSKSVSFERQLQAYIHDHVSHELTYFSAIRPLTSVAVARLFSRFPQYFEAFTSDNFVFRIDPAKRPHGRWSLESPKSLSSFILLAPWVRPDDMSLIFGRDFLNEDSLQDLFLRLTGVEGDPPLDCVGTVDELVLSLNLLAGKDLYTDSSLMKLAVEKGIIQPGEWSTRLGEMLAPSKDMVFPAALEDMLQKELSV